MGLRDVKPVLGGALQDNPVIGTWREQQVDIPSRISRDIVFEVLKNKRRRLVLEILKKNGGRGTLSELSEQIAARENDVEQEVVTSDQRKRVYVGLYQRHLPKLDGEGVINFDQRSGDIALTDLGEELCSYPTWKDSADNTWPKLSLGVSVVGLSLVLASWLQGLSLYWSLGFVAVTFGALGIGRILDRAR